MKHSTAIELMDRAFSEQLGSADMAALREHLDGCDSCRARYDKLARAGMAARAVARGEEELSPELDRARLERLSVELLDSVDSAGAKEERRGIFALPGWLAAGAAAAVLVVGIAVFWTPWQDDGLMSRGSDQLQQREDKVGLRLFALEGAQLRDLREEAERGTPTLAAQTAFKAAYTNLDNQVSKLVVCAVSEGGHSILFPAGGGALQLEQEANDKPLPGQAQLGATHVGNKVRVFGLFSEQPIDAATLQRALEARAKSADPTAAKRLAELPGVLQHSLLLQVAASTQQPEDGGSER